MNNLKATTDKLLKNSGVSTPLPLAVGIACLEPMESYMKQQHRAYTKVKTIDGNIFIPELNFMFLKQVGV